VGTAMMKASGGVGGRRYQIAAVLLTYAAVSMAAIPIAFYFASERHERQAQHQNHQADEQQSDDSAQPATPAPQPRPRLTLGAWLARLAMLGLASPFLELKGNPFWGAIGLVILFVGIKIAWRITQGRSMEVFGPFNNAPQPAA